MAKSLSERQRVKCWNGWDQLRWNVWVRPRN